MFYLPWLGKKQINYNIALLAFKKKNRLILITFLLHTFHLEKTFYLTAMAAMKAQRTQRE
jgi:hypothetical protein